MSNSEVIFLFCPKLGKEEEEQSLVAAVPLEIVCGSVLFAKCPYKRAAVVCLRLSSVYRYMQIVNVGTRYKLGI